MRKVTLALLMALTVSLASTVVEASGAWLPWMGASVNAGITTTQMKASAYLAWNLSYNGDSAQTWSNTMPQQLLNIPVGLYGVSVDVAVAPFVDMPDGRQSFKQVWVTPYILRDNIGPKNPLLVPTSWDPSRVFTYTFTPRDCSGDVKYLWIYAQVGGAKRKENGFFIPIFSNLFPNALTKPSHGDGFQLIGVIQYTTSKWVGSPPRDAAELGDIMISRAGAGGSTTHAYENIARHDYEDGMQAPAALGGYRISFWNADGTPYNGMVSKITIRGSGESVVAGRDVRAPVVRMGDTTPGTYHYTFEFSNGQIVEENWTLDLSDRDPVMRVTLP